LNPDLQSWIPVIAVIAAVVFVVQIVTVIAASVAVRKIARHVDQEARKIEKTLSLVQSRLVDLADSLEPVKTVAQDLALNLETLSETLSKRAAHTDEFLGQFMSAGQDQVSKVDYLVSDTIQKFEQTTEIIQKDLLKPAVEISSFVRGIRSGLGVLFSRKKTTSSQAGREEELFI